MKLNLKNFTGINKDGNRYRIEMESIDNNCIVVTNRVFWPSMNIWLRDGTIACVPYFSKEQYRESLKEALLTVQNETGIQLIKSQPKEMKLTNTEPQKLQLTA
jgi:hypothetical protein